ncbi:spermatogenesis-associated protein 17 [Rhizophlyctis rosea]|uniref:Spermatogenesis-associated protein 17 n=1 Tax=Rhizophlyctis rosea TaxID=64517 RepID=A0AAD5S526_9FUNG|nr:spermatogenesis-associated protein 17 [Rhizophlyctis rosea]
MALSYAKLYLQKGTGIIDDFFRLSSDAELHRQEEHDAACKIQKAWRGYVARDWILLIHKEAVRIQRAFRGHMGRKMYEREVVERDRARRMNYYNAMAVRIQKTWRGYRNRKYVFDFRARQHYIEQLKEKLEQTRADLSTYAETQRTQLQTHNLQQYISHLEKLAGTRHHLLGTKAIPGVFSGRVPDVLSTPPDLATSAESSDPHNRLHPSRNLGPLTKVPESKLRDNAALREWVRNTVGKNAKGIVVKPPRRDEGVVEDGKIVQGPFLPKGDLNKKKGRPFRPTLRVQTDYLSVINAWREERLQEAGMRITTEAFQIPHHVPHDHPTYFQRGDPYKLIAYGRKTFREEDPDMRISRYDFKNIVPPIQIFDDVAAEYMNV